VTDAAQANGRDPGERTEAGVFAELGETLAEFSQELPETPPPEASPPEASPPEASPDEPSDRPPASPTVVLAPPPTPGNDDPGAALERAVAERHQRFRALLVNAARERAARQPQAPSAEENNGPPWSGSPAPPPAPRSALLAAPPPADSQTMTGRAFIEAWKHENRIVEPTWPATTDRRGRAGRMGSVAAENEPGPGGGGAARGSPTGVARLPIYRLFASVGGLLIVLGALTVLFVAFQLLGTNWAAARSQQALRRQIAHNLAQRSARAAGGPGSSALTLADPIPGGAVAILRIPRLHVDKVIVEGTSTADLMKGPGHYPGTPLPGEAGNAAIAGHRTTYGAPFFHLDQLRPGDDIVAVTTGGTFDYRVSSKPRAVSPTDTGVLDPTPDSRLTLTTCTPAYSAAQRLIVVAELDPGEPPLPTPPARARKVQLAGSSVALSGDVHAWPSALLWAMVVLAAGWAAREWGRRWRRLPVYAIAAPFMVVFLFACFENVNRLLPANL
jgi:sortase A